MQIVFLKAAATVHGRRRLYLVRHQLIPLL